MNAAPASPPQRTGRPLTAKAGPMGWRGLMALLLLVVLLPSLPLYLLGATSMAAGAVVVCLVALGIVVIRWAHQPVRPGPMARGLLTIWLLVGLHFSVAAILVRVDAGRFAASWLLLLVFLAGARSLASLLFQAADADLHRALKCLLVVLLIIAAFGLAGIAPPASLPYEKPMFPFTEPSHFALSFVPFLLYFAVSAQGWARLAWIFSGVLLALSVQNMTLLVGSLIVALVCTLRTSVVLLPLAALAFAPLIDLEYFSTRLNFTVESDNLSALVFAQGWQLIDEALNRSSFWGLGFQQLGVQGTEVPFAELIYAMMNSYVNVFDGGFTLSKVVSEFGLLGMLLVVAHLALAWKATHQLRMHATHRSPLMVPERLACAVVVAYTVELFVRGNGYFTASSLPYAASVIYLVNLSIKRRPRLKRPKRAARSLLSKTRSTGSPA